jgi:hypothetical protein
MVALPPAEAGRHNLFHFVARTGGIVAPPIMGTGNVSRKHGCLNSMREINTFRNFLPMLK